MNLICWPCLLTSDQLWNDLTLHSATCEAAESTTFCGSAVPLEASAAISFQWNQRRPIDADVFLVQPMTVFPAINEPVNTRTYQATTTMTTLRHKETCCEMLWTTQTWLHHRRNYWDIHLHPQLAQMNPDFLIICLKIYTIAPSR